MKYFKISGNNNKLYFINIELLLWIEFIDEEFKILFSKGINDVLHMVVAAEEYPCIKDKLVKALVSAIQEGEDFESGMKPSEFAKKD